MRCVRMIHFTKQTFTHSEVIDTNFNLKYTREHSCWIKREQNPQMMRVVEDSEEDNDESDNNASEENVAQPQQTTFENVAFGEGVSSAPNDLALWQ